MSILNSPNVRDGGKPRRFAAAAFKLAMPPWLCFTCLFTLPVSCVMFQT